ncbi:MAG: 23S rRNA (uracil(1939)-C(5))-methyltransferase RlmD [Oculatellaceae cyanobacterium Prado106]|jgi:23S rRNA (uracil1939-C5)-methyltransferase|nr:23S rRNA (uracil(1939)-C(5))-methyltransferase RlmD [Oculatellaceae cyanobacterium Prado106]
MSDIEPVVVSEDSLPETEQSNEWQQGQLLDITIANLSNTGDGVGRWEGRVVFVPDTVVGDRIQARLVRVKPQYAYGKLHKLLKSSPHRIRPHCIVADKCGGCQWQHIDYAYQLEAKRNLVIQDLERIGGFVNPPVSPLLVVEEEAPDGNPGLGYRNKSTYPLARSSTGQVQAGYYQKGSHQLVNLNQCPIQDQRLNPILAEVKQDLHERGWSIYNEEQHRGKLRHLGLRIGRRTGEMLLTLVSTDDKLLGVEEQAEIWMSRYPELVGVSLNVNGDRTNAIFGSKTQCIAGQSYLQEEFAGLIFQIQPMTFFQVYTEQAEALLEAIAQELQLQGQETLVDAYCGIGTLSLPLARLVKQAIGLEVQMEAVEQARVNAQLNGITNVTFQVGKVEKLLNQFVEPEGQSEAGSLESSQVDVEGDCAESVEHPDIVLLDPPRKGCDKVVIESLLRIRPGRIVYVSCNTATLARDLKLLTQGGYQLTRVQPADFFPQTSHVECAAFLQLANGA